MNVAGEILQGLKPSGFWASWTYGLKPVPDASAPSAQRRPSGAKARVLCLRLTAGLKSRPYAFSSIRPLVFHQAVKSCACKALAWAAVVLFVAAPAAAKDAPRSFSLSTSRTFAPGESVKIQLFARNVPAFEFRVYKMKDPVKFFAGLKDVHSFGEHNESPAEQIEQKSWLERIHDWKAHLWWEVRHFFRGQFTDDARDSFREQQGKLGKKSRVFGASQFAQVPILNSSQLVARWRLETPPTILSETQQLPIDGLKEGVYLIEATDGTYKAYTVAIVTSMALVERSVSTGSGGASVYVADRKTGAPVAGADLAMYANGSLASLRENERGWPGRPDHAQAGSGGGDGRRAGAGQRVDPGAARRGRSAGDAVGLRLQPERAAE